VSRSRRVYSVLSNVKCEHSAKVVMSLEGDLGERAGWGEPGHTSWGCTSRGADYGVLNIAAHCA
jgi:hypothetical protein